jgi:alanine-glyoxylate transaminase / serine-glyoxylate transaminase / serine-pyruvate transaminase
MESVARQFATDKHVMVLRNGWFSFRWTEIFDMGKIPKSHTVLKAQPTPVKGDVPSEHTHFAPYPLDQVIDAIYKERPAAFFCPHVETSTGMMISDSYIRAVSDAVHAVGGLFVLDCIASGTVWVDMKQLGIDVVISAPQKGWTGAPCAALVMMSDRAVETMQGTEESSFSVSLKRWSAIMDTYENGGFGYHTTMPTDALRDFHEISVETLEFGLPELKAAQNELGWRARSILDSKGLTSVAEPGSQAPGVLVYYSPASTDNPVMMQQFKSVAGMQIAMGVPWRIDEPTGLKTFRIGLFGLDKLKNIDRTLQIMEHGLDTVLGELAASSRAAVAPKQAA